MTEHARMLGRGRTAQAAGAGSRRGRQRGRYRGRGSLDHGAVLVIRYNIRMHCSLFFHVIIVINSDTFIF